MKKQILTFFIITFFLSSGLKAQSYSDAFSFNLGMVQNGFGGVINYNYFVDRHDFIEAGVLMTASNFKYTPDIKIPYNDFTLNLGYSINVFYNYQNTFNINLSGGGVFGYETLNKGEKTLSNGALIISEPSFIYGAYLGVELDYTLTDQLSLTLKANEYYHANSKLGEFMPFAGLGLRYYVSY